MQETPHIIVDRLTLSYAFIITELANSETLTRTTKAFICEFIILTTRFLEELLHGSDDLFCTLNIKVHV